MNKQTPPWVERISAGKRNISKKKRKKEVKEKKKEEKTVSGLDKTTMEPRISLDEYKSEAK